jgi:hypothetical protein
MPRRPSEDEPVRDETARFLAVLDDLIRQIQNHQRYLEHRTQELDRKLAQIEQAEQDRGKQDE